MYRILAFLFLLTVPVYAQESLPTDEIVVKATDAVIFEMTANLKLTQDQVSAVRPVIADNIAKIRNLQQSLEDGNIDGSAMYAQKEQLINDENQEISSILTPDQMKVWMSMQNEEPESYSKHRA
jgi:hypothetical protein